MRRVKKPGNQDLEGFSVGDVPLCPRCLVCKEPTLQADNRWELIYLVPSQGHKDHLLLTSLAPSIEHLLMNSYKDELNFVFFAIFVPWPGFKPMPPAMEAQSTDHFPNYTRDFLIKHFTKKRWGFKCLFYSKGNTVVWIHMMGMFVHFLFNWQDSLSVYPWRSNKKTQPRPCPQSGWTLMERTYAVYSPSIKAGCDILSDRGTHAMWVQRRDDMNSDLQDLGDFLELYHSCWNNGKNHGSINNIKDTRGGSHRGARQ